MTVTNMSLASLPNLSFCLTRFSSKYGFEKPNDRRALDLMNAAAQAVMYEIPEVTIAYGISDEYRYIPRPLLS